MIPKLAKYVFDQANEEGNFSLTGEALNISFANVNYKVKHSRSNMAARWRLSFLSILGFSRVQTIEKWIILCLCIIAGVPDIFPLIVSLLSFSISHKYLKPSSKWCYLLTLSIVCDTGDQKITFSQVVLEVMRHLEGAYALIFKSKHYPNELVACKRGSPLLLGVKVCYIL